MPLLWIALSFITGIVIASLFSLSAYIWLGIVIGLLLILIFLRIPRFSNSSISKIYFRFPLSAFTVIFLFFGAWWFQIRQPNIDAFHVAFYNDRDYEMLVTGTLAEPPDYRDTYTNLRLNVEALDSGSGDLPVSGLLLVRVPQNQTYEYGQRVRVLSLIHI